DRTLFAIGVLNQALLNIEFAEIEDVPSAIATNAAGQVFVQHDHFAFGNPAQTGEFIMGFSSTGSAFEDPQVSPTGFVDATSGGALATLTSAMIANLPAGLGLQAGDLLNLLPNGQIGVMRPSTGGTEFFGNLKALVSLSTG